MNESDSHERLRGPFIGCRNACGQAEDVLEQIIVARQFEEMRPVEYGKVRRAARARVANDVRRKRVFVARPRTCAKEERQLCAQIGRGVLNGRCRHEQYARSATQFCSRGIASSIGRPQPVRFVDNDE